MGKSPETLDGKLLKVRENKLRRVAAKQGVRVVRLRDGSGYLLFAGCGRIDNVMFPEKRGGAVTLAEAEQLLADRQHRPPPLHLVS